MSLRDDLLAVRAKRGALTPAAVVAEARPKNHPLHSRFEWDDSVAGEKWRMTQAGELIKSVRVSYESPKGHRRDLREFHAIREDEGGHSYEPLDVIIENEFMTELLRRDMQRDWKALKQRYDTFEEFRQMVVADLEAS